MNNKSTENLIESSGSNEEFHVPPLDLKRSNHGRKPKSETSNHGNSDSDRSVNNKPKRVQNNFLAEKSSTDRSDPKSPTVKTVPIPAVRKLSLPPIASQRNGKDTKENSNQLKREQSIQSNDTIRIISERSSTSNQQQQQQQQSQPQQSNTKVNDSNDSESDSDIGQLKQSLREKGNKIELKTFAAQTKNQHMKSAFGVAEINEETTSFVSYEEKHEKEDNSEHSTSNHSSVNSKKRLTKYVGDDVDDDHERGVGNEAFVHGPDDNVDVERHVQIGGDKTKSKKKDKKSRDTKKSKEKHKKRPSRRAEQTAAPVEANDSENDVQNSYDFKKVIGVRIHETSALRFDRLIRQPRVRVSFYNLNDGELLNKSNPLRNAVSNYEPTNVTFIQPILSNRCVFKDSSEIECDWNNELLIINEDIHHIQKHHVIIFFEIVDIINTNRNLENIATNGWYPICWAFLKPGDDKIYSNLNVKCAIQLYYYQPSRAKRSIIDEWKAPKRKKYPAYLSVTVGSYQPETTCSVSLTRPMSVLEEETTGDIYTCASDGDEPMDEQSHQVAATGSATENPAQNHRNSVARVEANTTLKFKPRLPGQQCECPNRIVYKHNVTNHIRGSGGAARTQYGSMVAKFNLNGTLLAFHCTAYMRTNHEIIVLNVNQLLVTHNMVGHLGIVYDLNWLNDSVLVSVSTDRTAIVWYLTESNFKMKVLPHPSFVYACKWLSKSMDDAYIVTGGRDCVLRIWKISTDIDADIELCEELIQHENYITSLAASRKSTKIYSADWNGVLLQWSLKKGDTDNVGVGPLYQMKRKIKIFPKSIARIELHAKFNRLFVQCINDPLIYAIETTSAVVIQTIKYAEHDHNALSEIRNTFTVSPCGSLLFVKCPNDDQIKCMRLSNEEQIAEIRIPIPLTTRKYSVTSLAYHPTKNLMVCSIFGDSINSSLFFICNEMDTAQIGQLQPNDEKQFIDLNDNLNQSFHALNKWQKNHEQDFIAATENGIKSIAIDSILNRIDDLFAMAIQSPKQTDDKNAGIDQFKEVQELMEKIRIDSIQNQPNETETNEDNVYFMNTQSNEPSCQSGDSNRPDSNGFRKRNSWQLQNTANAASIAHNDDESQSNGSNHTFSVEASTSAKQQENTVVALKSDENELSNATFSVGSESVSDHSNLTFEIPKAKNKKNGTHI